jgi:2-keto-3-deoxy-L-rhamnonate aldolase RhmA
MKNPVAKESMMKVYFRDLLQPGRKIFGAMIMTPCQEFIEILAWSGFDYVVIDQEHSPATYEQTMHMIRTADSVGLACMIRVPEIGEDPIKKALDMGATGLKIPTVTSVEEAREAVRHAKYPPQGTRGACPYVRANRFGAQDDNRSFYKQENERIFLSMNIEGPQAVKNVRDILAVDGVDAVSVGRMDLSVLLGIPGEVNHPAVKQAVMEVAEAAHKAGKSCGAFIDSGAEDLAQFADAPAMNHFLIPLPEEILYRGYKALREDIRRVLRSADSA